VNDHKVAREKLRQMEELEEEIENADAAQSYVEAGELEELLEQLHESYHSLAFVEEDEDDMAQLAITPIRNSFIADWEVTQIADNFRFRTPEDLRGRPVERELE
jgi:C4-type Zn-finger protein